MVISIIGHPILPDAMVLTAIRMLSGFSVAGCYTLIESWLQAKTSNENRGRLLRACQILDMSFLFGLTTYPIYSICAAHASDFVGSGRMISLSALLIFL